MRHFGKPRFQSRTLTIKEDNLDFEFRYNTVDSARAGILGNASCVGLRGCEVGARDCESNVLVHDARVDQRTAWLNGDSWPERLYSPSVVVIC